MGYNQVNMKNEGPDPLDAFHKDCQEYGGELSQSIMSERYDMNPTSLDQLNNPFFPSFSGDSYSDNSSPSTNDSNLGHPIKGFPYETKGHETTGFDTNGYETAGFPMGLVMENPTVDIKKPNSRTKKQTIDDQDAFLLSKDDSELTEQEIQLKRKAQNRAAQRAFRERKETKLKELESRLNKSEDERQRLLNELDDVRRRTLRMQAENEYLKNQAHTKPDQSQVASFEFPRNQTQFINRVLQDSNHVLNEESVNKIYDSPENGTKVLAIGAVWDYLLYRADEENLNLDVVEVMTRLRGNEKCHGWGPAYSIDLVDKLIGECSS